jgi:proteasome accessory factor C
MKGTAEERLQRILAMIPWIVAHDGPTVAATCARFACTPTDLARDIELLYLCGLHPFTPDLLIEAGIVDGRVFVQYADYLSRPLRLTPSEGLALVASAGTLLASPGNDPDGPLSRGLAKLASAIGSPEAVDVHLGNVDAALVESMRDACATERQVEIDYYAYGRDETTTRLIEPAAVFASGGAWYVAAYCHRAGAERSFRLDRVLAARPLTTTRSGPQLDAGPQSLRPGTSGGHVTVDIAADASWVHEQYPVDKVQPLEHGGSRVTLRVSEWPWLDRLLLRLGDSARVIDAPADWPGRVPASERIVARYRRT